MAIDVTNTGVKFNNQKQKYGFDFYYEGIRHQRFRWNSERKATTALLKYLDDLENETINSNIKFGDLCEKYYSHISGSINKNTLSAKKQVIKKHIIKTFENRQIRAIKVPDISDFQNKLLDLKYEDSKGEMKLYSNDFIDRIQTELWGIFSFAHIHGFIKSNPTLKLNRVRHNSYQTKKKFRRVSASDAYKVIDTETDKQTKLMLLLSYEHGLRPSEIAGLNIEDIDFEKRIIHIKHAWKSKEKELTATKNGEDRFNATSIRVLEAARSLLNEYDSVGGYTPEMTLFGLTSRPAATTMTTWKDNAISSAGVKHFTWYDLRHNHITDLLELGFKPYQIAERMGHTEIQTLDYAIVDIQEQFDMVEALENRGKNESNSSPKNHQDKSKDEILEEINRLMQLL